MTNKRIFLCDDSIDGIFTAVYQAWSSRLGHANVKLEEKCEGSKYSNIELFAEYVVVDTDLTQSYKVAKAIREKISEEVYEICCLAAMSDYGGKADLIYRFLVLGFAVGCSIVEHLSNEVVNRIFRISKNVNNEHHHLLGFIRFSQLENGLLVATIHPKNNVLSLITPHFADRLPQERFIIYDGGRKIASVHVPGTPWMLVQVPEADQNRFGELMKYGDRYKDLWITFFDSIAIKERENYKLQRGNLPIRFRADMTEFNRSRH